ncbi:type IV pilin [Halomicrobium salinisoli]|uniref:type IV pilin n=1 Tax=Halomicrobium salinisoli TaxID=2878391 RepID=UPI001CF06A47|nr:type IV pilin N-terminal domain-containing protein [Halomicrobium salinisoli]
MDLKKLLNDDNAVSPVIGVILMVAITVILAAVIASFVLNLGDQAQQSTPTASIDFEYVQDDSGNDDLIITHESGDTIDGAQLNATVTGAQDTDRSTGSSDGDVAFGPGPDGSDGNLFGTSDVTAGTSHNLSSPDFYDTGGASNDNDLDYSLDLSEATVRITYTAESGGSSSTLTTWEGPDA